LELELDTAIKNSDAHLNKDCLPYSGRNISYSIYVSLLDPDTTATKSKHAGSIDVPPPPLNIRLALLQDKKEEDLPAPIADPTFSPLTEGRQSILTCLSAHSSNPGYVYYRNLSQSPKPQPLDEQMNAFLLDLKTHLQEGTITASEGYSRERESLDSIFAVHNTETAPLLAGSVSPALGSDAQMTNNPHNDPINTPEPPPATISTTPPPVVIDLTTHHQPQASSFHSSQRDRSHQHHPHSTTSPQSTRNESDLHRQNDGVRTFETTSTLPDKHT